MNLLQFMSGDDTPDFDDNETSTDELIKRGVFRLIDIKGRDIKTDWLIDQLIPRQGLSMLTADSNWGKSFLAIYWSLLFCREQNSTFLQREVCGGNKVAYVASEAIVSIAERADKMANILELSDLEYSRMTITNDINLIQPTDFDCVVIDTLLAFVNGQTASNVIQPVLGTLDDSISWLIVNHTVKGKPNIPIGGTALKAYLNTSIIGRFEDDDNPNSRRFLLCEKSRLSSKGSGVIGELKLIDNGLGLIPLCEPNTDFKEKENRNETWDNKIQDYCRVQTSMGQKITQIGLWRFVSGNENATRVSDRFKRYIDENLEWLKEEAIDDLDSDME